MVRGRFGSYEPIDFLALMVGYAVSGERTLSDFFVVDCNVIKMARDEERLTKISSRLAIICAVI